VRRGPLGGHDRRQAAVARDATDAARAVPRAGATDRPRSDAPRLRNRLDSRPFLVDSSYSCLFLLLPAWRVLCVSFEPVGVRLPIHGASVRQPKLGEVVGVPAFVRAA